MKCTPMKLMSRKEFLKSKKVATLAKNGCSKIDSKVVITTDFYGYSFKLSRLNKAKPKPTNTANLAITNLSIPDNFRYNTGSSMEKWSKKRPRLRSARKDTDSCSPFSDEYDMTFDISNIINDQGEDVEENDEGDENIEEDEVDSDIEKLILESQRTNDEECDREVRNITQKPKRHKSSKSKVVESGDEKSKRKIKQKLKKTIRFSFSKPPSPETEQVIRVDVTTNMTVEELKQLDLCKNSVHKYTETHADCSKGHSRMINDRRKELERTFNDNIPNFDGEDEDFIVRCRQLALTQKRR